MEIKAASREIAALKTLKNKPALEKVRNAVEQALGQPNCFTRDAAIYLTRARIDCPLKEIAAFYALSPKTVGAILRKMKKNLAWNIVVKSVLDHVEKELCSRIVDATPDGNCGKLPL